MKLHSIAVSLLLLVGVSGCLSTSPSESVGAKESQKVNEVLLANDTGTTAVINGDYDKSEVITTVDRLAEFCNKRASLYQHQEGKDYDVAREECFNDAAMLLEKKSKIVIKEAKKRERFLFGEEK